MVDFTAESGEGNPAGKGKSGAKIFILMTPLGSYQASHGKILD